MTTHSATLSSHLAAGRWPRSLLLLAMALLACRPSPTPTDSGRSAELSISGIVYQFGSTNPVPDATVCVEEEPNRVCVQSGSDGIYVIPLTLLAGEQTPVTVTLAERGYPVMRTRTLRLHEDLDEEAQALLQTWHLQSVVGPVYEAYKALVAAAAGEPLSVQRCHIAGTVTDHAKAHHYVQDAETGAVDVDYEGFLADSVHGVAGVEVTLLAAQSGGAEVSGHGPVYANEDVIPVPERVQDVTSVDGGFFFYNLPEGEYEMVVEDTRSGHDLDHAVAFDGPFNVSCARDAEANDAGVFVNVSPPQISALEAVSR
jgi:hypothetical protein